jgi:hypothetical protein
MAKRRGRESNCKFDSRPKKFGNRPDLLGCRQRATYRWKALDESYNFASDRTSIQGLLAKLWGSKVPRVPAGEISGLPRGSPDWRDFGIPMRESQLAEFLDSHAEVSGVPGEKNHLNVGPVERCRVYYKGEGGDFPQVWAVVSLVCLCCP